MNDRWLRIIGTPLFAGVATLFFYSDFWLPENVLFWEIFLVALFNTLIYWEANRHIMLIFRRRFPSISQTPARMLRQLGVSTIISLALCLLLSFVEDYTGLWKRPLTWPDYLYNCFVMLLFVYFGTGLYESLYYFRKWRQTFRETEQLKKANLQSQFDSLKNQVNPHFLFNSLNTLSSLIEENPSQAIRFVDHLSKVYRYLLQNNEKELIPLREETDFLQTYFFLLKVRFGEGISMTNSIPAEYNDYLIPPLTLQILVENAVKHNVVSAARPLHIELLIKNNALYVVNNRQVKTLPVPSNGMGLTNIAAKYKLLNQPEMVIMPEEKQFSVQLPLIYQ